MARYDSADLLAKLKKLLRLPAVTEQTDDTSLYEYLAQAQEDEVRFWAPRAPESLYGPWTKLVTADNGLTYTFGVDAASGLAVLPFGHFEVRAARDGEILFPGADWQDDRYVWNGVSLTWPHGKARMFANGPWARWVTLPQPIAVGVQPSIPLLFRPTLVPAAAVKFADEGGLRDPSRYERKLGAERTLLAQALGTAAFGIGAPATDPANDAWWKHIDDRPENYTRTG